MPLGSRRGPRKRRGNAERKKERQGKRLRLQQLAVKPRTLERYRKAVLFALAAWNFCTEEISSLTAFDLEVADFLFEEGETIGLAGFLSGLDLFLPMLRNTRGTPMPFGADLRRSGKQLQCHHSFFRLCAAGVCKQKRSTCSLDSATASINLSPATQAEPHVQDEADPDPSVEDGELEAICTWKIWNP